MTYKRNLKLSAEKEGLFSMIPGGEPCIPNWSLIHFVHKVLLFSSVLAQASLARPFENKNPPALPRDQFVMRRKRDSNPRNRGYSSTVFKTAAFDRSAISPDQSLFVLQYSIPHNHPAEAGKFLHFSIYPPQR